MKIFRSDLEIDHQKKKISSLGFCTFLWQGTQTHWTRPASPEPKSRIKRFSERGVVCVEVDQWVRGDSVEGQSASRTVHIHCYSVRDRGGGGGGGGGGGCSCVVVPDMVTVHRALQTPRLIIPSKPAVISDSSPVDSSVTHWYINMSPPLCLPVTATSQSSCTQQLTPVESVRMIGIWLFLLHVDHLPVVVRQFDLSVYCICVDCEFTGIWWRNKTQLQLFIYHLFNYWHQMFEWVTSHFVADLFTWIEINPLRSINALAHPNHIYITIYQFLNGVDRPSKTVLSMNNVHYTFPLTLPSCLLCVCCRKKQ